MLIFITSFVAQVVALSSAVDELLPLLYAFCKQRCKVSATNVVYLWFYNTIYYSVERYTNFKQQKVASRNPVSLMRSRMRNDLLQKSSGWQLGLSMHHSKPNNLRYHSMWMTLVALKVKKRYRY